MGSLQFPTASLNDCRPTLYSPRPSLSSDGLFLFILAFTLGLSEPWYTKRFMLPFPNLISIEEFRHHARALFTLLRKAARSASYCSSRLLVSPWQLEYITSRNAQSFYLRRLFFITVPCLPQVLLGRMMLVSLTHHSYIAVISLTLGQPFHGSRTVLSLPGTLINFYRSGLYPAV